MEMMLKKVKDAQPYNFITEWEYSATKRGA